MFGLMSLCFYLMIRRPPRSTRTDTLFPYTTLFRSRVAGLAAQRAENIGMGAVLRLLARCVIEHDVVWVDQADDHEPRLAARFVAADEIENAARRVARDIHIGAIAVPGQAQFFAVEAVIMEAVFLHGIFGAGIDAAGDARPIAFIVEAAEVPFALVAGVIARGLHHVTQRRHVVGHHRVGGVVAVAERSEEQTSELQSLM